MANLNGRLDKLEGNTKYRRHRRQVFVVIYLPDQDVMWISGEKDRGTFNQTELDRRITAAGGFDNCALFMLPYDGRPCEPPAKD